MLHNKRLQLVVETNDNFHPGQHFTNCYFFRRLVLNICIQGIWKNRYQTQPTREFFSCTDFSTNFPGPSSRPTLRFISHTYILVVAYDLSTFRTLVCPDFRQKKSLFAGALINGQSAPDFLNRKFLMNEIGNKNVITKP
jgi:hypothetical protein